MWMKTSGTVVDVDVILFQCSFLVCEHIADITHDILRNE